MMSKKKNWQDHYWQSSLLNSVNYQMYRNWIISLAVNRYRWTGLPDTCDERYLETTLIMEGVATIAHSDAVGWVSTKATSGRLNVYDNPTSWQSVGNNGWYFDVTPANGVLVWDNRLRTPMWDMIHTYALRLAEYDRVLDINLQQQKVPWIVTGPQEKRLDMENEVKQALGGEPVIIGVKGMENIEWNVLTLPSEMKADQIQSAKARTWNEIYEYLGIANIDSKQERMIEAEVDKNNMPTELRALDGLQARREACDYLNDTFGLDIHVYWHEDLESKNYNYTRTIQEVQEDDDNEGDNDNEDNPIVRV